MPRCGSGFRFHHEEHGGYLDQQLDAGESRPMSSISPSNTMMEHARSSPETLSLNSRNSETGKSTAVKTTTPPR